MNPLDRINISVSSDKQGIKDQLETHPKTKNIIGEIDSIDQLIDSISGKTFSGGALEMHIRSFIEEAVIIDEPFDQNDPFGGINRKAEKVNNLVNRVFRAVGDISDKDRAF